MRRKSAFVKMSKNGENVIHFWYLYRVYSYENNPFALVILRISNKGA